MLFALNVPSSYLFPIDRITLFPLRHTAVSKKLTGTSAFPITYMSCNTISCHVSMPRWDKCHRFSQDMVSGYSIDAPSAIQLLLLHGATCLDPAPYEDCRLEQACDHCPPARAFVVRSTLQHVHTFRSVLAAASIHPDAPIHLAVLQEATYTTPFLSLRPPIANL